MRSILGSAVADGLVDSNPCQIAGVSTSRRAESVRPAIAEEIEGIAAAMPYGYQLLILLAAWLGIPLSELGELRRKDVDLVTGVVRVRRAVALIRGNFEVATPRSREGIRDITIPGHLLPRLEAHLREHAKPGQESLLFPSLRDADRHLNPSVMHQMFGRARETAGLPDLRVPDLLRAGLASIAMGASGLANDLD